MPKHRVLPVSLEGGDTTGWNEAIIFSTQMNTDLSAKIMKICVICVLMNSK
jgi:hypothetical protein